MAKSSKEDAKKLIAEIEDIDRKLEELYEVLKANHTDMTSPLVDNEDFPLPNMDLYAVRTARHNINCLQNDRKKLSEEFEKIMFALHEEEKFKKLEIEPKKPKTDETAPVHRSSNKPFAKIDKVSFNSPAYIANIKPGDLIIQFGNLHADNYTKLDQLSEIVKANIDKFIKLTVIRDGHPVRLEVKPGKWDGPGVLGCLFSAVTTMNL
uniref:26S proteasome non-ATPase regulatory subunit 9 n=1 Tax=Acrobeloides nanus TaxID=290746 RepID=A0A914C3Q5_9BILA